MGNNIGGNDQDLHQVRKGVLSAKQNSFSFMAQKYFITIQQKNTTIKIKT